MKSFENEAEKTTAINKELDNMQSMLEAVCQMDFPYVNIQTNTREVELVDGLGYVIEPGRIILNNSVEIYATDKEPDDESQGVAWQVSILVETPMDFAHHDNDDFPLDMFVQHLESYNLPVEAIQRALWELVKIEITKKLNEWLYNN